MWFSIEVEKTGVFYGFSMVFQCFRVVSSVVFRLEDGSARAGLGRALASCGRKEAKGLWSQSLRLGGSGSDFESDPLDSKEKKEEKTYQVDFSWISWIANPGFGGLIKAPFGE